MSLHRTALEHSVTALSTQLASERKEMQRLKEEAAASLEQTKVAV